MKSSTYDRFHAGYVTLDAMGIPTTDLSGSQLLKQERELFKNANHIAIARLRGVLSLEELRQWRCGDR